ncbi:hypothetical protein KALB_5526 [Kutzneria albida DSM 43870]|uniref:Secreted protein n=1 Tax=Kutzneria albida DSM 43870 TaxID=1449976 RepID=W5WCK9_9PSEU|nr:hypothetical protein KALB_5526 [Kutzneria albida DSM 43870]
MSKIVRFFASASMALGVSLTGAPVEASNNAPGRCPGGFTWDGTECVPTGSSTSVAE